MHPRTSQIPESLRGELYFKKFTKYFWIQPVYPSTQEQASYIKTLHSKFEHSCISWMRLKRGKPRVQLFAACESLKRNLVRAVLFARFYSKVCDEINSEESRGTNISKPQAVCARALRNFPTTLLERSAIKLETTSCYCTNSLKFTNFHLAPQHPI